MSWKWTYLVKVITPKNEEYDKRYHSEGFFLIIAKIIIIGALNKNMMSKKRHYLYISFNFNMYKNVERILKY